MTEKKVAIVTGASSGIGEGLSRDLVGKGWHVAMADLKKNDALIKELGDSVSFHETDVADYDSQAKTFQEVFGKYGRIDALLANAGIVDKDSVFIFDHRDSDTVPPKPNLICTDVDYKGVVYGTQLAIHFMRKNKYDGAKAAVFNFVRAVSRVLKNKENIRINVVLPGVVATSIIPPEMVAAVSPECLTPISTVVAGYNRFLEDESLYGQALEASADKLLLVPSMEHLNGRITKRAVTVWDPLFKMLHHENSGLPDAIPCGKEGAFGGV
ncbi:15-hydroxyprostaglandin dehydrogenase [Sodiomyces alkalinus F11]|uniref:15-hydroxyprostaglandin dehydrogenase n=1 Tax=Sodiomyces alkalinus (strain CBS 110278 / VKM F-3762 / F11) TaxID=1314773 RepID=A0A3N2PY89_SODAK|nr:15-hydroxyprostaglandin dehydrogenase [Sodiomyces alkalinus F11]ROT39501.1 15-hydroxyprostaglandin dehydrogenase [Sodiomyces alkalinus F11]